MQLKHFPALPCHQIFWKYLSALSCQDQLCKDIVEHQYHDAAEYYRLCAGAPNLKRSSFSIESLVSGNGDNEKSKRHCFYHGECHVKRNEGILYATDKFC